MIGAGVLGSSHALALVDAGFEVTHLEADLAPRRASVRNFGLIWVSGRRPGAELEAAERSRTLWEEIGRRIAGVGFRPAGSLTVALDDVERKVMEAFAAGEGAARGIELLEPDAVRERNPAIRGDITGALWCAQDAAVEPRLVPGAIRDHLTSTGRYDFHGGVRAISLDGHTVIDQLGRRWDGDLVVCTPGAAFGGLLAPELAAAPLQRVRLQMLQTEPLDERLPTAIADADSMRYYPAYAGAPLDQLHEPPRVAVEHAMQLLLVQRLDGSLTIGDTHAYDEPFAFDLVEPPSIELLRRVEAILGRPTPPVARRWEGVYAQRTDGALCHCDEVAPRIWLVTGPGGRGMTLAPVIAERTLAAMGI